MKMTKTFIAVGLVAALGVGLAGCDNSTTNPINVAEVVSQVQSGLGTVCAGAPTIVNIAEIVESAVNAGKDVTDNTTLANSLVNSICNSIKAGPVATNASAKRGVTETKVVFYKPVDGVVVKAEVK